MIRIAGAAIAKPTGIARRGSFTSPAMNGSDSGPVHANAITDQKMRSLSARPGFTVEASMCVAEPNFHNATRPRATSSKVTVQRQYAPILFSHFPTSRPRTLTTVASAKPKMATPMKYHGDAESEPPLLPVTNNAFPAAKYNNAGKYGRLLAQYVHPVMKPANG